MARPCKRHRQKSSIPKVRQTQPTRKHHTPIDAHPLIQKHWNKNLTLHQNYAALGIVSSINGRAGGTGREALVDYQEACRYASIYSDTPPVSTNSTDNDTESTQQQQQQQQDDDDDDEDTTEMKTIEQARLEIAQRKQQQKQIKKLKKEGLVHVPVAPEQNIRIDSRVTRIGVPLATRTPASFTPAPATTSIVDVLQEESKYTRKVARHASVQEHLVLYPLIDKYGDNYNAMCMDIKLNRYQLSAGQLKRKIMRLNAEMK